MIDAAAAGSSDGFATARPEEDCAVSWDRRVFAVCTFEADEAQICEVVTRLIVISVPC